MYNVAYLLAWLSCVRPLRALRWMEARVKRCCVGTGRRVMSRLLGCTLTESWPAPRSRPSLHDRPVSSGLSSTQLDLLWDANSTGVHSPQRHQEATSPKSQQSLSSTISSLPSPFPFLFPSFLSLSFFLPFSFPTRFPSPIQLGGLGSPVSILRIRAV